MDWFEDLAEIVGVIGAIVLIILLTIGLVVGLGALEAWVVMLLWNCVLCALFPTLPILNFWMACGLMILCSILFGSTRIIRSKGND